MRISETSTLPTDFRSRNDANSRLILDSSNNGDARTCFATRTVFENLQSVQETADTSICSKTTLRAMPQASLESSAKKSLLTLSANNWSAPNIDVLAGKTGNGVDERIASFAIVDREMARSRYIASESSHPDQFSINLERTKLSAAAQVYLYVIYGRNIERLSLAHNEMSSLPIEARACSGLRYLNLRHNNFQWIPSAIFDLSRLQILDLSVNRLVEISDRISSLQSLRILDISENKIQELPRTLADMIHLEILRWNGNDILDPVWIDLSKQIQSQPAILQTNIVKQHLRKTFSRSEIETGFDSTGDTNLSKCSTVPIDIPVIRSSAKQRIEHHRDLHSRVREVLVESGFKSGLSQSAIDIASLLSRFSAFSIATSGSLMSICSTYSKLSSQNSLKSAFPSIHLEENHDVCEPQGPHAHLIRILGNQNHYLVLSRDEAEAVDPLGYTALHIAAMFRGCTYQILWTMRKIAEINQVSLKGETFLHLLQPMTHSGCKPVNLEQVLQQAKGEGFRFDTQDFEGVNALYTVLALRFNGFTDSAVLRSCLLMSLKDLEADHACRTLTQRTCRGKSLFDWLVDKSGCTEAVKKLYDSLYQQLIREQKYALAGSLNSITYGRLLSVQAYPRASNGDNPIHQLCALFGAGPSNIDYLRDESFWVSLSIGRSLGDYASALQTLLDYGIDANDYNEAGMTPLMILIKRGSQIWIELSLDMDQNVDKHEKNPRKASLESQYIRCVDILIRGGAKIYRFDRFGDTVLLQTILQGFQLGFCVLVELGANINIRNKRTGESALQIATEVHRRCNVSKKSYNEHRNRKNIHEIRAYPCIHKSQTAGYAHSLWILTLLVDLGAVSDPSLEQELGLGVYDPALHRPPLVRRKMGRGVVPEGDVEETQTTQDPTLEEASD